MKLPNDLIHGILFRIDASLAFVEKLLAANPAYARQQFRRDYWVKGARRLSWTTQAETLREQRVILAQPRTDVSLKVTGALREATLQESVYEPILDELSQHLPKTLGTAEENLAELTAQADTFSEKQLPILKALGL